GRASGWSPRCPTSRRTRPRRLLSSGFLARHRAPPGNVAHAVSFGVLFVHGPGGNAAGVARSIADPVFAEDQCDGSVQHEHARVELVGVRLTVHMGFELAFADLIAFPTKFG